jgi:hypothetical protein
MGRFDTDYLQLTNEPLRGKDGPYMATTQLEDLIRKRTDLFVAELTELVKEAALESVGLALGRGGVAPSGGAQRVRRSGASARRKGEKRTPESLEQLTNDLFSQIKSGPGRRIEQIAKQMRTTTKELALPARKLLEAKKIKTTGRKRATKYFAK